MKDLTIYILTHNRLKLLCETIKSILKQDCNDFKIVVSDNSTDDKSESYFLQHSFTQKIDYIRRKPALSSLDHYNVVLSEVTTQYFMLFHDDDLMLPKMVSTAYSAITSEESIAAVGCNAYLLINQKKTGKKIYKDNKKKIINKKDFANSYLNWSLVPFPFYMYNKLLIKNVIFTNNIGKYSDVFFLLEILRAGKMVWLAKPLGFYRIHESQDSATLDFINQLKLVKLFKSCNCTQKKEKKYRIYLIYLCLINKLKACDTPTKYKLKQTLLLLYYSPFNFFPKILIRWLIKKY